MSIVGFVADGCFMAQVLRVDQLMSAALSCLQTILNKFDSSPRHFSGLRVFFNDGHLRLNEVFSGTKF